MAPLRMVHAPVRRSSASWKVSKSISPVDRRKASKRTVKTHLTWPVHVVVLYVSDDRVPSVLEDALLCPLARPGRVRLERARARVRVRHRVSVVRPHWTSNIAGMGQPAIRTDGEECGGGGLTVPEDPHELWMVFDRVVRSEHTGRAELLVDDVLGESGLDNVGSV